MAEYRYSMSECDVKDRGKLETFRAKRSEWVSWLKSGDPHSIWPQINQILWDDVLFRTINDLRREAIEHPAVGVGFNANVLRLLDAGFVTTQATAIRRLTDKPDGGRKRGVLSLRRLIKEIEENRGIITREVYVAYDGLPYDPNAPWQAWIEKQIRDGTVARTSWLPTTGPEAWGASEIVHKNFDRLAGVVPKARSRDDLILLKWFEYLERRLTECDSVRKFVDKFIAHAADPVSREGLTTEEKGVTLDRLRRAQKAIYQVAAFIYGPLLWEGSYGAVPTPHYDHLEYRDKSWLQTDRSASAHEHWRQHLAEVEAWEQEGAWENANSNGGERTIGA